MDHDLWHERWEQDRIGFHQETVNPHLIEYWPRLGLRPDATVFVPLCGKALDLYWLAERGHEVLGVEISPVAVKAFFDENGLAAEREHIGAFERWRAGRITLLCGDFFDLGAGDLIDVVAVFDRASLIAFPEPLRQRYAAHLLAILPPEVTTLLVTLEYDQAEMDGPPFSVLEDEVRSLFGAATRIERLAAHDVLDAHERFKARGLTHLEEKAFLLERGA